MCSLEVPDLEQSIASHYEGNDNVEILLANAGDSSGVIQAFLREAGTELNSHFYSAGLIDQIIHLATQKNLKSGVPGLLYDATTATALAFPRDTDYIKVQSCELAGDHLSIWQRDSK